MRDQNETVTVELAGAQAKRFWSTPLVITSAMSGAENGGGGTHHDGTTGASAGKTAS